MSVNYELSATEKAGDPAGEPNRRAAALIALREAIVDEARVRNEATRLTESRAETAVWLGASLADLASITGHSRQAARKRWPGLGGVTRRRRWLSHHVEEVLWAGRLALDHAAELPVEATAGLAEDIGRVTAAFTEPTEAEVDPVARWLLLEVLVDHRLRLVADTSMGPDVTGQARFARDGAVAVVSYYDHAVQETTTAAEDDGR